MGKPQSRDLHEFHYTRQNKFRVELVRNVVAYGDAREGKWRGNWRMEWVASTLTPPPNVVYPTLLKLMRTPRLPAVDWTDALTDLNGLVRFGERRNVVSARVPSGSARDIPTFSYMAWTAYRGVAPLPLPESIGCQCALAPWLESVYVKVKGKGVP